MLPDDLRSRLLALPPAASPEPYATSLRGDHLYSPDLLAELPAGSPKPAAVLIPIVPRADGATVLFTQRSAALKNHPGQIAFPGGRIDDKDGGPLAAALREAEEEIGLAPAQVELLGYLDLYQSTTGYQITPVVGLVSPPLTLRLNPAEVDEAFEVPLAFLLDARNHKLESREWRGRPRSYVAIPYGRHYIWGVTAGILRSLHERVST
jgi:8-oxo-dGTP pyrophosphatase MutT (NUDIX family)